MKNKVKIGIWGFGSMGQGMAKMCLEKKGTDVVAVISRQESYQGKSVFDVLGVERGDKDDLIFEADAEKFFGENEVDIVLLGTDSTTKAAFPKIKHLIENKINVISTAEEMAFPMAQEPELAAEIDKLAKANGVSVLGTGINPGFVLDMLILALTGTCIDVESIDAARVNDLSPFGQLVMKGQGVGTTKEEFLAGVKDGSIVGHVGFPESIDMVATGLGWKLDKVEQTREPILSTVERVTNVAHVDAGNVAGCRHHGYGYVNGKKLISMEHPQQILPELEGQETGDYINIKGTPNINLAIQPEIPGGIGTIAMCVNMIPHVINARPGLKTMLDLPVPRAMMGDIRDLIEE